jgi:FKBP-type peptidyl-prolyl cis-trans isomerase
LAMSISSCFKHETDYEKRVKADEAAILNYLRENQEDAEKSMTGVFFKAINTNTFSDRVMENSVVSVNYTVRLLSGQIIEEYDDMYNPVKLSYSDNALLPIGLYEIGRMRLGETYRFYVPSYLAFNTYALEGVFPAHSNFIIDLTVVDLISEEYQHEDEMFEIEMYLAENNITTAQKQASGVYYIQDLEGTGSQPGTYSQVKIHFTRSYLDGTLIRSTLDGQPLIVPLGNFNLVPGLEEGIRLMKKGGKATIIVPSKWGFGRSVQVIPQIVREAWVEEKMLSPETLPYSIMIHEVELLDLIQ